MLYQHLSFYINKVMSHDGHNKLIELILPSFCSTWPAGSYSLCRQIDAPGAAAATCFAVILVITIS